MEIFVSRCCSFGFGICVTEALELDVAAVHERDENVRYFINVRDAVTMGSLGHRAPANAVFRSSGDPLSAHKIAQWQGSSAYQDPIYHAPPETRVHAHKQVYPVKSRDSMVKEDVEPVAARSESVGAPHDVQPSTAGSFDFGDVPEFDYGVL